MINFVCKKRKKMHIGLCQHSAEFCVKVNVTFKQDLYILTLEKITLSGLGRELEKGKKLWAKLNAVW